MSNAAQRPTAARRKPRLEPKRLPGSCFDVVLVVAAAPVVLLLGAPATGYAIGSAAWVLLRLLGAAVDRRASTITHWSEQVGLRLSYRFLRLVLLAVATLFALSAGGKQDGVTALVVIALAFTLQLSASLRDGLRRP